MVRCQWFNSVPRLFGDYCCPQWRSSATSDRYVEAVVVDRVAVDTSDREEVVAYKYIYIHVYIYIYTYT